MNNIHFPSVGHILKPTNNEVKSLKSPAEAQKSFANVLRETLKSVNDAQVKSDIMTEKLVQGEAVDLHQVMIAAKKANITMQATIEVRNKIIESYQEIMRMQV